MYFSVCMGSTGWVDYWPIPSPVNRIRYLRWLPDWDRKDCHGAAIWNVSSPTRWPQHCFLLWEERKPSWMCFLLHFCMHVGCCLLKPLILKWRLQLPSFHVPCHTSRVSPQPSRCCSSGFWSCFVQSVPVDLLWSILISALHDAMQGQREWLQSIWEFQVAHALGWSWFVWGHLWSQWVGSGGRYVTKLQNTASKIHMHWFTLERYRHV